ncbi:MAG: hypothetical protein P4N60_23320 [Verrucomicrobiae bacterium]|nr:hypothetical protein [Verrucomicrobiae bacterium]
MKISFKKIAVGLGMTCLLAAPFKTFAFALLGPYEPWMQATNGVFDPVFDIGGPMDIDSEYRWNVPVVTYGFDKSFLDYFGTNGVAAVESAIKILNDLPPASTIVLTNYPFSAQYFNSQAEPLGLVDLKSQTLSLLLEQMGLAQPSRYIYVLKQWDISLQVPPNAFSSPPWPDGTIPQFILMRNFDPQTLEASVYINETLYSAYIAIDNNQNSMVPFTVDQWASSRFTSVAEFPIAQYDMYTGGGKVYTGLTYDDVGGLVYLLSTNNINYETLLPDITGIGINSNSFVNGAWRPGVDKITFLPQSTGVQPGVFMPMTHQYADTYFTNGNLVQQQLQRVTFQPDFLFSARPDSFRTGTTNWINNAAKNGNLAGAGPGTIRPPVVVAFQKMGGDFYSSISPPNYVWSEDSVQDQTSIAHIYGSFDNSTNPPIVYPVLQSGEVSMALRMSLSHSNYGENFYGFEWSPTSQAGTVYALQTSTNLSTWGTLFAITNNGSVFYYRNVNANSPSRFYRLLPQ